jgi:two-component system, OmpR family, sensor kinase
MDRFHDPRHPRDGRLLRALEQLLAIDAIAVAPALNRAADLIGAALGAEKVDVFLHDPSVGTLVSVGASDTPLTQRQHALGLDRQPLANGGRTAEVFRTGESFETGHADADPGELVGVREALGIRSTLAAAFAVDGERRGVLVVQSARPARFGAEDLPFTEAIARWVGMLTHRAELAERTTAQAAAAGRQLAAEELVTVLAHDLRNHLSPLLGRLQLIRRRAVRLDQPDTRRDAEEALAELRRLERLIGDLLDVARLDQGLFHLERRPVDLADLARTTAATLQTAETPIDVRAPEELVAVVDPDRLRQALENLLANARAHSPEGAVVTLAVAPETQAGQAWATLTVGDQGPGIAPELAPRLFTRFAGGPGSDGLGLGLYLAHAIAAAHGGTLTADAHPGTGACFTLAVPV